MFVSHINRAEANILHIPEDSTWRKQGKGIMLHCLVVCVVAPTFISGVQWVCAGVTSCGATSNPARSLCLNCRHIFIMSATPSFTNCTGLIYLD